jgi:hypothetical protein
VCKSSIIRRSIFSARIFTHDKQVRRQHLNTVPGFKNAPDKYLPVTHFRQSFNRSRQAIPPAGLAITESKQIFALYFTGTGRVKQLQAQTVERFAFQRFEVNLNGGLFSGVKNPSPSVSRNFIPAEKSLVFGSVGG